MSEISELQVSRGSS